MEAEKKKYTIEDIARELGVSKTTVSRALSGKGRIGRETVERVQAFAKAHGYRPNVIARGLAQSRTYNLGLVIPTEDTDVSFFKECMDGICEKASEYNYYIIVAMMKEECLEQLQRLVMNHKADGIILTRATMNSDTVRFLKEQEIPFVVIGPPDDLDVVSIDNPNREASRELTALLLLKGLRRIALVGGDSRHHVTESRKQGFLDAHKDRGFHADDALIFMEIGDYRRAMWAVDRILLAESDGIVCMDDHISALVLGCLRERGVEVPSRIRLASLYDSHQMEQNLPAVTSLRFDTRELGRNACLEMLRMLGEELFQEPQKLDYQVILRESTK